MKKLLTAGVISAFLVAGVLMTGGMAQAQEDDGDSSTSTIEALQEQVRMLQEQVTELRTRLRTRVESGDDGDVSKRTRIRIEERLEQGNQGLHVRRLQELLATDADIYPEGLVTGFYGPLTTQAVARLQAKMDLRADGEVNAKTLTRINTLLEKGAGNSGVIPPGLLRAPDIQQLLSAQQSDDSETETETEVEVRQRGNSQLDVDSLPISETLKERLRLLFENKGGESRFRFRSRTKSEDSDNDDELEIEVEIEDDRARVEIKYPDGSEIKFRFETTDRSEVVEEIKSRTKLTENEIESVIEFETDNEDEDDDDDGSDDDNDEGDDEDDSNEDSDDDNDAEDQ